jgi:hypothetical protein
MRAMSHRDAAYYRAAFQRTHNGAQGWPRSSPGRFRLQVQHGYCHTPVTEATQPAIVYIAALRAKISNLESGLRDYELWGLAQELIAAYQALGDALGYERNAQWPAVHVTIGGRLVEIVRPAPGV